MVSPIRQSLVMEFFTKHSNFVSSRQIAKECNIRLSEIRNVLTILYNKGYLNREYRIIKENSKIQCYYYKRKSLSQHNKFIEKLWL